MRKLEIPNSVGGDEVRSLRERERVAPMFGPAIMPVFGVAQVGIDVVPKAHI